MEEQKKLDKEQKKLLAAQKNREYMRGYMKKYYHDNLEKVRLIAMRSYYVNKIGLSSDDADEIVAIQQQRNEKIKNIVHKGK